MATADELHAAYEVVKGLVEARTRSQGFQGDVEWHVLSAARHVIFNEYLAAKYPAQPVEALAGRRVTDSRVGRDVRDADVIRLPQRAGNDDGLDAA